MSKYFVVGVDFPKDIITTKYLVWAYLKGFRSYASWQFAFIDHETKEWDIVGRHSDMEEYIIEYWTYLPDAPSY